MKKVLISACIALSITSGCAMFKPYEAGTHVTDEQMATLKDKIDNKQSVGALIGQPGRREQLKSSEIWYYDYQKISHFSAAVNESRAFEFDNKGVLIKHYVAGTPSKTNTNNALIDAYNKK